MKTLAVILLLALAGCVTAPKTPAPVGNWWPGDWQSEAAAK